MTFAAPLGLALALLAVPVILLHVLRPKRQPMEVSSTFLWRELAHPVSAATPWQRLRFSLLLLLQVLAVLLLALGAARPVQVADAGLYEHTVFLVDTSGSMGAKDGDPDRVAEAIDRARDLRGDLPTSGEASLIEVSSAPRVLLSSSPDRAAFEDALDRVGEAGGRADFATAFTLAASLETPESAIGYVLLSDGRLTDDEKALLPPDTRYEAIGERATNRAITRLTVEPRGSGLHVRVTLENTGGPAATQPLRIDVDAQTVETTEVALDRGEIVEFDADVPPGDQVEVFLEGEDLLDADDHAFAVASRRRDLSVLVVGPEDVFITELLAAAGDIDVETDPGDDGPVAARDHDLVIYDGVEVPADPGAPFLAIAPPAGVPGAVTVVGERELPAVVLVRSDDPLLDGVDVSDLGIAMAQQVEAPTSDTLVGAEGAPLLLRGTHAGRAFSYLSFALADSTLPLDIAYPILFDRLIAELAGVTLPPSGLTVGDALPVDPSGAAVIDGPGGLSLEVAPGDPSPRAHRPGFWTIRPDDGPERVVAVNAHPAESHLAPEPSLPTEARTETLAADPERTEQSLLRWVIPPLIALLALEFLVARRAVGVSRRQWRVAKGMRVAILALLVAALLDAAIVRDENRVATVFLVDGSDSLGAQGREDAVRFVREALAEQPDGARSAVALFGGDARLELTLDRDNELDTPAVQVDTGQTDLANALRLAGAVLPDDAKRRIVVVSDGRATRGDAAEEARRLRELGVEVDVRVVARDAGTDAAVAGIDLPATAHEGDEVTIETTVEATDAGPATLTLLRDGDVVDEKVVDLEAGANLVRFTDTATGSGLQRYQVRVSSPGDAIAQNDVGYGAVEIEGPATVLVIEGMAGDGEALASALESGGIETEIAEVADIPPLDELAAHDAFVLVDVDERALAPSHVAALSAAVRDLGRGLVTIGGDRSYALGGYLDSELEELLPVISEIQDPERRRTVAEVLAIDTSGSMAACHCNEGANGIAGGGNRGPAGGVSKTDISRSAAARAIEALGENDEVGVLAFNSGEEWVIPLQKLPPEEVVFDGLDSLRPSGGTDLSNSLEASAAALRSSKASLRHIILFTDGFTGVDSMEALADQAAGLREEGITVSVLATGEGAAEQLAPIAARGGGRFYPGRDLQQIPQIMMQETIIASRNFVNEGEFLPQVTSSSDVVADLVESPPLFGYLATTARPQAATLLRIGDDGDPLLASWQIGLGRSTAWTSDASQRWSQAWADWDGYVDFWSGVVKDVLPTGDDAGAVRARVEGGVLQVTVEGAEAWPDGARATGRVTTPGFESHELVLERIDDATFRADLPAGEAGTYAVGVRVEGSDGALLAGRALASQGYAAEYRPGEADRGALLRVSELAGGRGEIDATMAFDAEGLVPGTTRIPLAAWLLLAAALLWPVAVATSRLALRGAGLVTVKARLGGAGGWLRSRVPPLPGRERATRPTAARSGATRRTPVPAAPPATVGRLLERKRERQNVEPVDDPS